MRKNLKTNEKNNQTPPTPITPSYSDPEFSSISSISWKSNKDVEVDNLTKGLARVVCKLLGSQAR